MQHTRPAASARRRAILELLERAPVPSQASLRDALAARGFAVNQATLSRDLRALVVVKGSAGYRLAAVPEAPGASDPGAELSRATRQWLLSLARARNQLVLRTPPGGAQPLALALDRAGLGELLGTIAGDDTVLAICPDDRAAARLAGRLGRMRS